MGLDKNSQKPEQIKQSIIDGDTNVGRDVNIDTINQTSNQANIINNYYSSYNTPRIRQFQAPPTPEYYVDRPEVSQDLKRRLLAEGGTLIISAIHGLGSVGKSTLAAALAHDTDIQKHFNGGVLWATLGQEPDVLSLLGGWVQGLGDYNYRATSTEATSAHLNTLLFDKAVLLVVDDAWLDENKGWEPVKAFRVGGDLCRMLVTTRDASIANFLGATTYSLDVMSESQALELLVKKLENQGKQLKNEEIESAQALAKAVGYLPLALELAAAQVASGTSWQVLIADVQQEIARLKSFQDPGIRQISDEEKFKKLSLQASLNLSLKRLSQGDRECFAWLGVLPEDASITSKMTATLWEMDERDARETLQYLRSQALLLPGVLLVDATATYRLHDLFHDLARNLLTAPQKPKRQGDLVGLGMRWEDVHGQLLDKYWQQTFNNLWQTVPDDSYIHQYLVWHLEKAGRVEEIHQLLREDSASGNNGWYEVREKLGQTAGFLTDVARAWELAEAGWEKKNLSQVVGLQCRYALIIASLNSLAAKIPTELIVVFVKNKFWYPEQGLAYTLQKQDFRDKANSLILLADYLPQALKQQALKIALELIIQVQSGEYCADTLSTLVEKLPENLCKQALEVVRQIQNKIYRVQPLSALAVKLRASNLYDEALEIARQIQDDKYRAQMLSYLAQKFQNEKLYCEALEIASQIRDFRHYAQALSSIAKNVLESCYVKVLAAASKITDEQYHAQVLSSLAQNLKDEKLYEVVLEAARQFNHKQYYTQVISSLTQNLQDDNLCREALELARHIQPERYRAQILLSLAQNLPKKYCNEVLETARQINDEQFRAQILSYLAQNLQDENLYREALEIARQINDERYRIQILSSLAQNIQERRWYSQTLKAIRQINDERYCAQIISSLAKSLPKDLYTEVLEIIYQVQNEQYRAQIILSLARNLPEDFYAQTLQLVRHIYNEQYRIQIISLLAHRYENNNLYIEALEVVRVIQNEEYRSKVLLCLIEELPKKLYNYALEIARKVLNQNYRFQIILSLAQHLQNENLYYEALEAARQIQDNYYRALALSSLAHNLQDKNLYCEALEVTCQIQNEYPRAQNMSFLARRIPDFLYETFLEATYSIQCESNRVEIILSLANNFKYDNLYIEVIATISQIHDEYSCARTLSNLAAKIPEKFHNEALKIASKIQDDYSRSLTLCAILKARMSHKTPYEIFASWLEIIKILARFKRKDFQESVESLIPVIFNLGDKEALNELASAIQDVGRWWR